MRRRALAGLTLSSFLLSILIGGLWLRSYAHPDTITHRTSDEPHFREVMLAASRGRMLCRYVYGLMDQAAPQAVAADWEQWDWQVEDPAVLRSGYSTANEYGFTAVSDTTYQPPQGADRGATWTKYGFVVPFWFLFVLSLILPGASWMRRRRSPTVAA